MKKIILILALVFSFQASATPFEGSAIPTGVYLLACDSNPRITITFANGTPSVWYPANGGYAKEYLSIALAAKATSSPLYCYGADHQTTPYCVSAGNARAIYMIGIQ